MRHQLPRLVLVALTAALTTGAAPAGHAALRGVYQGRIGENLAIVLRINEIDPQEGGAYHYTNRGLDIRLGVHAEGNRFTLTEQGRWQPEADRFTVTGVFTGSVNGNTLVGMWRSGDGRRQYPFRLTRVQPTSLRPNLPDSPKLREWRTNDPYTFLKVNRAFQPTRKARMVGGVRIEEWREPLAGVTAYRVTNLHGRAAQDRVNGLLQDDALQEAVHALECRSDAALAPAGIEGYWEAERRVLYASPRFLSIHKRVGYFCGGAHPGEFVEPHAYDLTTGREVTPAHLFDFGNEAQHLIPIARRFYPKDAPEGCARVVTDRPSVIVTFAAKGLIVQYDVPHVAAVCGLTETLVPYAALKHLANPKSSVYREFYP